MRVIAGKCRSLPLKTLPGKNTRPTTDRIKETLFNILQPELGGACFLDLFAGSGSIGIEALSRGAESCIFVEKNRQACGIIRENLKFTRLENQARVMETDAASAIRSLSASGIKFDVVFMDPPYSNGLEHEAMDLFAGAGCVHEDTLYVIEAALDDDFGWLEDSAFTCVKWKKYKTNQHLFIRKKVN